MSNATNGFAGWMKKNPGMALGGFLFIVALIAIIVVIGWAINKGGKKPEDTTSVSSTPQLTITGVKTVNPIKASGYTIGPKYEYALGEFIGDNIDFTITAETKGGFEESGIIELLIKRMKSDDTVIDSKTITGIKNYSTFSVTFKGGDLSEDAVGTDGGTNTFKVIGVTASGTDSTPATLFDADNDVTGIQELASATQTINKPDLNYTTNTIVNTTFTFDMSDDTTGLTFASDVKRTVYYISIDPSKLYKILIDDNNTNQYIFQETGGANLTVDGVSSFKIDKIGDKYRLYDGGKFVTKTDGTGAITLKEPHKMTPEEAETSMITLTVEPLYYGGKFWLVRYGKMFYTSDGSLAHYSYWKDDKTLWEIVPKGDGKSYWLVREGKMYYTSGGSLAHYAYWKDDKTLWEIIPK